MAYFDGTLVLSVTYGRSCNKHLNIYKNVQDDYLFRNYFVAPPVL